MKRAVLGSIAVIVCSIMLQAQDLEIGAYTGWMFGGAVNYSYTVNSGKLKNVDSQNYGGTINYRIQDIAMLEIGYMRMDSDFEDRGGFLDASRGSLPVSTEYFQIGALKELGFEKLRPYGMFTLGAVRYHTKEAGFSDLWRFAINLGLGAKVYLGENERFGLRVQARMMAPINWAGVGLYCGTGGCGSSVNVGSTVIEGDLTGGVFVVLK